MIIESKAPTRVDFAGSTLDIWPLYLFHPGSVTLNAAISLYASCRIETNGGESIRLVSRDIQREESFPCFTALMKTKFFRPQGGFTLMTDSKAPAGAGIGGSSAMAVAICAALDRFTGAGKSKEDWIHISRDAEAIVINVPTGTQDHYPPAFGGAAAIELPPGGEHRVELRVNLDELERRVVVCYTGKPRQHGINNWEVFKAQIGGKRAVQQSLERISEVAQCMRVALEKPDWKEAGRLMREEWSFRRRNLPTISTKTIDRVIESARRNGALAGKVCGAGGGGCVVLLIEPEARDRAEKAVAEAGGEVLHTTIDRQGVSVVFR